MPDAGYLAPTLCPYCGEHMTHADEYRHTGRAPEPGDLSLCIACGRIGKFTGNMVVRRMTPEEMEADCMEDPELRQVLASLREGWRRLQMEIAAGRLPPRRPRKEIRQ